MPQWCCRSVCLTGFSQNNPRQLFRIAPPPRLRRLRSVSGQERTLTALALRVGVIAKLSDRNPGRLFGGLPTGSARTGIGCGRIEYQPLSGSPSLSLISSSSPRSSRPSCLQLRLSLPTRPSSDRQSWRVSLRSCRLSIPSVAARRMSASEPGCAMPSAA